MSPPQITAQIDNSALEQSRQGPNAIKVERKPHHNSPNLSTQHTVGNQTGRPTLRLDTHQSDLSPRPRVPLNTASFPKVCGLGGDPAEAHCQPAGEDHRQICLFAYDKAFNLWIFQEDGSELAYLTEKTERPGD